MPVFKAIRCTRMRTAAGAVLLALAAVPCWAVQPFSADYQASYMGLQGTGKMSLAAQGGGRWKYSLHIDSKLARLTQSTVFEERNGQWRPLSSDDASFLLIKQVRRSAVYDWDKGVATWSGDVKRDRAGPVRLQAGDMDAMMINLALARDATGGTPLRYRMVEDGRSKQLDYSQAGRETIVVDGTSHQAIKLVRSDGDKQTIAWVVPGVPVPVRMLQRENGRDALDLRLQRWH